MGRRRLIIFTKYPEPGQVKTRLIPALGEEGAASLQKKMTEHSLAWAASLSERVPNLLEIRYEGKSRNLMAEWLGIRLKGEETLERGWRGPLKGIFRRR
jgi:glycosyltransferase A (GT-A) superfamily protein (DUF2064 family)